jgi:hypothetical protein
MKIGVLLMFLMPISLLSQINIHKAGDNWDSIVKSALNLIQKTSPEHYIMVVSQVEEIEFWNEAYSSNTKTNKKGVIVISSKDIALNSINNLAAVIVHESYHLFLTGNLLPENEEEYLCYSYELKFLKMLPYVEPDLLEFTTGQIKKLK